MMLQNGETSFVHADLTEIAPLLGGHVHPLDPASFRASLRWLRLEHLLIRVFVASPHEYEAAAAPGETEPAIAIGVVGAGTLDGRVENTHLRLEQGDALVYDSAHPLHYRAELPTRVLSVMLDGDQVLPHLRSGSLLPASALRRTPLLNSYIAFVSALISRPLEEMSSDSGHLCRAMTDLHLGVLAEARGATLPDPGTDGLRYRISEFVDANLSDPELSPGMIASALGISLRYAHQVFNSDETTIARFIRDRRLDAAAAELRDPRAGARAGELAARFGFGSRDQLARAFRRRFGMTMREYRDAGPNRPV